MELKLFAMVFGDKLIRSSSLEGSDCYAENNLDFILKILSSNPVLQTHDKQPLINELTQLRTTSQKLKTLKGNNADLFIGELQQQLSALKAGERFLFPGGWQGKPGHFILYAFEATHQGFIFNLYNTGGGTEFHAGSIQDGKHYINPIYTIKNIPKERVCSSVFLNCLLCLKIKTFKGLNEVDSNDIYDNLLRILEGQHVHSNEVEYVSAQQAGTCTWKAIIAFLKNRLPRPLYFEVLYQLKFWCLANYVFNTKLPAHQGEAWLLEKSAHGLANLARKIYLSKLPQFTVDKNIEINEIDRLLQTSTLCEKALTIAKKYTDNALNQEISVSPLASTLKFDLPDLNELLNPVEEMDIDSAPQPASPSLDLFAQSSSSASSSRQDGLRVEKNDIQMDPQLEEKTPQPQKVKKPKKIKVFNPQIPPYYSENQSLTVFFKEWKGYIKSATKTSYEKIAFYHLENMILTLPYELDLSSYKNKERTDIVSALFILSKKYFIHSCHTKNLRLSINLWHLFILLSKFFMEELSKTCPKNIKLEDYGFRINLPKFLTASDVLHKTAVKDLEIQKKIIELNQQIQRINTNKRFFLFDTMETSSFWVSSNDYGKYVDFKLIAELLKTSSSSSSSTNATLIEEILQHYSSQPKKGAVLPPIYYNLQTLYIYCSLAPYFSLFTDPGSIYRKPIKITFEEDKNTRSTFKVVFAYKKEKKNIKIHFPDGMITDRDYFHNPESLDPNLFKSAFTQNSIRARSKQSCLPSNQESLSKYEINRLGDIHNAKSGNLSLCLNYYLENPFLLEKKIHRDFLKYVFYSLFTLHNSCQDHPAIRTEFVAFITKLLTIYAGTFDSRQIELLTDLFQLGLDYNHIHPQGELARLLKSSVIHLYDSSKQQAEKAQFGPFVLQALAASEDILQEEEIILALKIIVAGSIGPGVDQKSLWKQRTEPLLFKLEKILDSQMRRDSLFLKIPRIRQILDIGKETTWSKDKFLFSCQGCTFDLLTCIFNNPNDLSSLLDCKIGLGENTLREIIGQDYTQLILKDGEWVNPEGTLRLFKSNGSWNLHQRFDNQWCEYAFYSEGLHVKPLNLPYSLEIEASQEDSHQFFYASKILWYKPLENSSEFFLGKAQNDVFYKLEKVKNKWTVENRGRSLLYATIDMGTLPSSLIPLRHWPEDKIEFWVDKLSSKLADISIDSSLNIYREGEQYILKGYEQFKISEQRLPSLFKSIPPYFQLVDRKGHHFTLIPNFTLEVDTKGTPHDPLQLVHKFTFGHNHMYLYGHEDNLSPELKVTDLSSRIYLSYLYFVDQNYEKAYALIEKCCQTTPFEQEHLYLFESLFTYVSSNGGRVKHPMQFAILIKTAFLIFQASAFQAGSKTHALYNFKEKTEKILKDYKFFWNAIPAIYRLSKHEEFFLLNNLNQTETVTILKNFLTNPDPSKYTIASSSRTIHLRFDAVHECPIAKNSLGNFNYITSLEELPPQNLKFVRNKLDSKFTPQMAMALWMGSLTEDPHLSTLSAAQIAFLRLLKKSKLNLAGFLVFALNAKQYFMEYLRSRQISLNMDLMDYNNLIDYWNDFLKTPLFQELSDGEVFRWPIDGSCEPLRDGNRGFKSLAPVQEATVPRLPSLLSLSCEPPSYGTLMDGRLSLLKKFIKVTHIEANSEFSSVHAESKANQLLEALPLAKILYNDFRQSLTHSLMVCKLRIPAKITSSITLGHLLTEIQNMKLLHKNSADLLKAKIEKGVNSTPLEEGAGLTLPDLQLALKRKTDIFSFQKNKSRDS